MMKQSILVILFLCYSLVSYTQVISGTVYDQKTHEAIYSASVYFNGTFNGTLTDKDGNFHLDNSKGTQMPLTVSALGYFSATITEYSSSKPVLVYLAPKLFELNEVVVNAKSHSWKRKENLEIFRQEFLGKSKNALYCKIINEEDIKFKYDSDDTVKAYAIKPIQIENKALGYKITYYLDKFEYYKLSSSFFFQGNIIFSEDLTSNDAKKQFFERNRKLAYLGSRLQFFRSLWIDDLNAAGFTVKNPANETLDYRKITEKDGANKKYIKYPSALGICYYSKSPSSFMILMKDRVFFDSTGYFDPMGINWEGAMAQQRLADWLPYEFVYKK
jgi:hypothetical protein